MANHYFSTNRGRGEHSLAAGVADITTGTSSTSGDDIEVRLADAASLTKEDVKLALERITRFIQNAQNSTFPPI